MEKMCPKRALYIVFFDFGNLKKERRKRKKEEEKRYIIYIYLWVKRTRMDTM